MRLLFLTIIIPVAYCLTAGDEAKWSDYPYLVKVAASVGEDKHYGCTGVLITPGLVLTSSKCFDEITDKSPDAIVMSIRGNGTTNWKRATIMVKKNDDYAILSIKPRKNDVACPSLFDDITPRVSRLPLSDGLKTPLWNLPDLDDLIDKKCRLVGFETVAVDEFGSSNNVLQMKVELEKEYDLLAATVPAGKGPCYEDYGTPLECQIEDEWTLVGLVQTLTREVIDEEAEKPDNECSLITGVRFSTLDSASLHRLLKTHVADIFKIQRECFPRDDSEEKEE